MRKSLVLTLLGPDRPGLVEAIAAVVAEHEGNWLESRMASLAGEFAGLLHVEVDESRAGDLESALASLGEQGLDLVVKVAAPKDSTEGELFTLELVGQDRPGIVREISQALAGHGVNVEELESGRESAPMTGEILFRARALLRLPNGGSPAEVQSGLEAIGADLMVDIELQPLDRTG